mmetsp:Transcript_35403/g.105817  ORF Transcript_35403/g.105817 Transcript_35403/m.105817 type:complete len:282 (-) Transcript_35403:732-1577(-)
MPPSDHAQVGRLVAGGDGDLTGGVVAVGHDHRRVPPPAALVVVPALLAGAAEQPLKQEALEQANHVGPAPLLQHRHLSTPAAPAAPAIVRAVQVGARRTPHAGAPLSHVEGPALRRQGERGPGLAAEERTDVARAHPAVPVAVQRAEGLLSQSVQAAVEARKEHGRSKFREAEAPALPEVRCSKNLADIHLDVGPTTGRGAGDRVDKLLLQDRPVVVGVRVREGRADPGNLRDARPGRDGEHATPRERRRRGIVDHAAHHVDPQADLDLSAALEPRVAQRL